MRIVWDDPKRRKNVSNHGLDFADAEFCDWDHAVVVPSYRGARGERRMLAIVPLTDALVTVVFAPLGTEAISIISMRPASRRERTLYAETRSASDHR